MPYFQGCFVHLRCIYVAKLLATYLDCFHLAMRIQHVAQAVKGWPDDSAENRAEGAHLADAATSTFAGGCGTDRCGRRPAGLI